MPTDCNGREIKVGDTVEHIAAKEITEWGEGWPDTPKRADGSVPPCCPFQGPAKVQAMAGSRCVSVDQHHGTVPVFVASQLEVITPA